MSLKHQTTQFKPPTDNYNTQTGNGNMVKPYKNICI